jgi:hypothetical protein
MIETNCDLRSCKLGPRRSFYVKEFSTPGGIISPLTLSASAMLKPIARDGHVYAVKHLPWPFVATGPQNLTASLELVPEEGLEPPTY